MISIKKCAEKEIDWDALDRCWADRYMEEYGHYFTEGSLIQTAISLPVLTSIEESVHDSI